MSEALILSAEAQLTRARRGRDGMNDSEITADITICPICERLRKLASIPFPDSGQVTFTSAELRARHGDCDRHKGLLDSDPWPTHQYTVEVGKSAKDATISVYTRAPTSVSGVKTYVTFWEVLYENGQPEPSTEKGRDAHPRLVDPHFIDPALLKSWLTCCESEHAECAHSSGGLMHDTKPGLLIDVIDQCLVDTGLWPAMSFRYVALSYVWGTAMQFLTTATNLSSLTVRGALIDATLPATIRQAMELTRVLDYRYIWVDALCIVHDHSSQDEQLNNMAGIFANGDLTIVQAAGEHADFGFQGLPGISPSRNIRQTSIRLSQSQQLVRPGHAQLWTMPYLEPWSRRAWTFQEDVFSNRTLFFAHDTVRWSCDTAYWSEESTSSDCVRTYSSPWQSSRTLYTQSMARGPLPQLWEYVQMVNRFNERNLTYSEDALLAWSGIATALSLKFQDGFISGLPAFFFDVALLWQPWGRFRESARRIAFRKSRSALLPSWSWAGWTTEIAIPFTWDFTPANNPMLTPPALFGVARPFYQITPYIYDQVYGRQERIPNQWLMYAEQVSASTTTRDDWIPHEVSSDGKYADYGEGTRFYTHRSAPATGLYFPIPLSEDICPARNVSFISFSTSGGWFKLAPRASGRLLALHAMDDTPVGILWNYFTEDYEKVHDDQAEERIYLIAILGCPVRDRHNAKEFLSQSEYELQLLQGKRVNLKDVYMVMWIQWDADGTIAYRKCTGQVDRALWERYAEDKDREIILG